MNRLFKVLVMVVVASLALGSCSKKKRVHHDDDSSTSEMSSKCDSDSVVQTKAPEPQVDDVISQDFSPEEQDLAKFSSQIFAGTEDVWTEILREQGYGEYRKPTLVLYTGSTNSVCGQGQAVMGPFYCSGDQRVYLDLSFLTTMEQRLGAGGDFAYAYLIAHEVGHHVENLTGVLDKIHAKMRQYGQGSIEANKESVRIELITEYLAGCWAHYDNGRFDSLDDGDLREAINCVMIVGDDYLQKSQGYALPESFTHGTIEQRFRWFKAGYESGDVKSGINALLNMDYNQL